MSDFDPFVYLDAAAAALDLPIPPAKREAVTGQPGAPGAAQAAALNTASSCAIHCVLAPAVAKLASKLLRSST